jgi:putative glutamine amidotransferase
MPGGAESRATGAATSAPQERADRSRIVRPTIGVTCSFEPSDAAVPRLRSYLNAAYTDAIYLAGGIPFPITPPPEHDPACIDELLARCDGVLFSGGADVSPQRYGQSPHPRTAAMHERRDRVEFELFQVVQRSALPVLSICLGCQVANVACGGGLVQHVDDLARPHAVEHYKPDHSPAYHDVRVVADSLLERIVGKTQFEVNSRHHQVLDPSALGAGLRAVAFAPDGVVEAAEMPGPRFMLAVQWHPEDLIDRPEHMSLFRALVAQAAQRPRG